MQRQLSNKIYTIDDLWNDAPEDVYEIIGFPNQYVILFHINGFTKLMMHEANNRIGAVHTNKPNATWADHKFIRTYQSEITFNLNV